MTAPLLCHRCGYWSLTYGCDRHMHEKKAHEDCFLFDRVADEEYVRRAKILGLAMQVSLFGSMKLETEVE